MMAAGLRGPLVRRRLRRTTESSGATEGMSKRADVMVVVPANNAERFLRETLDSALRQAGPRAHVVVVDDASTDATLAIARDMAGASGVGRLTVIARAERGGPSEARNVGWRLEPASAYVAFLDADDLWDARKLEVQVDYLERHPDVVAVGSFMRYVSSDGRVLGRAGQRVDDADQPRIARGELVPFPTSSVVVRRAALEAVDGFDAGFRHGSEDLDLFARLAQRGRVACVPEVLGSYRIHPASAMARDRRRINAEARFVRRRLAARAAGGDLTFDEFWQSYRPGWHERRQDLVEVLYRSAALWYGERRPTRAIGYGLLALLADPTYTLPRLLRQRGEGA